MTTALCTIDDCNRASSSRGWCHTHYIRWYRHGHPEALHLPPPPPPCSVDGCDQSADSRGWCLKHYTRWRTHGDPLTKKQASPGEPLAWLMAQVNAPHQESDPCVIWPFPTTSKGYGVVRGHGSAHRVLLVERDGPASFRGAQAIHGACHNRLCVTHVSWGTNAQNQADRDRDGTSNKGERNGQAKLNRAKVALIHALRAQGRTHQSIADVVGVSRSNIGAILSGKRWAR